MDRSKILNQNSDIQLSVPNSIFTPLFTCHFFFANLQTKRYTYPECEMEKSKSYLSFSFYIIDPGVKSSTHLWDPPTITGKQEFLLMGVMLN